MTIKASALLLALSAAGFYLVSQAEFLRPGVAVCVVALCFLGFAAWITDWVNYGLGRMRTDVTVSRGEAAGLAALRRKSGKGDLVATNRHELPGFLRSPERSYGYGALSERNILLEGWKSGGADNHPLFERTRQANDLLFTTVDEKVARRVVKEYGVKFIVAKPDTDISLQPLPVWLTRIPETGTLKVYRVW